MVIKSRVLELRISASFRRNRSSRAEQYADMCAGGVVMCAGSNFRATFHSCRFDSCETYVVHGASVSFAACEWHACGVALSAHGPATSATAEDCAFNACKVCALAEAGAVVGMHSCVLSATHVGAVSNDAGSHVSAEDSCITLECRSQAPQNYGMRAAEGSTFLRRCSIACASVGAVARGYSSSVQLAGVSIRAEDNACMLEQGAHGALTDVSMRVTRAAAGRPGGAARIALSVRSARVQVSRCDLHSQSAAGSTAIRVRDTAHASLQLCRVAGGQLAACCDQSCVDATACAFSAKQHGINVTGEGAVLRMHGGEADAGDAACCARESAYVAVSNARLSGGYGRGHSLEQELPIGTVAVLSRASARLCDCRVLSGFSGVCVTHGTLHARRNVLECVDPDGPMPALVNVAIVSHGYWVTGSRADVRGGAIRDFTCAAAVLSDRARHLAPRTNSCLKMHGVLVERYAAGVVVGRGSETDVQACTFLGHEGVSDARMRAVRARASAREQVLAAVVMQASHASLRDCTFRGNRHDITCSDAEAVVHAENCEFTGDGDARRTSVIVKGRADLHACRFATAQIAVEVTGSGAHCALCECSFARVDSESAAGVMATHHASVKVFDCVFACPRGAMKVSHGGEMEVQDCTCDGAHAALGVAGGGGTLTAKRVTVRGSMTALAVYNYAVGHTRQHAVRPDDMPNGKPERCVVNMEDCNLSADHVTVSVADVNTEITLTRCEVRGGQNGVQVIRGAVANLRHVSVMDCVCGVLVGEHEFVMQTCGVCGLSGDAALTRAFDVARGAVPAEPDALCMHQGTVARAHLHDVHVRNCSKSAVHVEVAGVVKAANVRVRGCRGGFVLMWAGECKSTFQGCLVSASPGGGVMGMRQLRPTQAFQKKTQGVHWEMVCNEIEGIRVL